MAIVKDPWGFEYDNSLPPGQWQTVKTNDGRTIQVDSTGSFNKSDPASAQAFNDHVNKNRPPSVFGKDNALYKAGDAVYDFYIDKTAQADQPGVGGPINPADAARLQKQQDGTFRDPATGTTYTDASGQTPIANPNVAQQVAANDARARDFLGRAATGDAEHAQTFAGQTQLDNQFQQTIAGKTPSVAQTMLGASTDALNRRQLSAAAGVGGANAFAARRQALGNIATQGIAAGQGAAILRAKEINDAQTARAANLSQMSGATDRRYAIDTGSAADFAGIADTGQRAQQGLNTEADKDKKRANRNILSAGMNLLGVQA